MVNELKKFPQTRSAESKRWGIQSIYRIPHSLKEQNGSSPYRPQTVSIGPYHHGEPHLDSMEEHKRRALLTFLHRSKKPVPCYIAALTPVAEDLMDAYQQLDPRWKLDREAFLELMVIDGCFVLELMRTDTHSTRTALDEMGYAHNDPVFSHHGKLCYVPYLKRDMLLLENQIPFLLLYTLLAIESSVPISDVSTVKWQLTELIAKFFIRLNTKHIRDDEEYLHILDLYRRSMLSSSASKDFVFREIIWSDSNIRKEGGRMTRPATKLKVAGIRFAMSDSSNPDHVAFDRGAVLKLPKITVDDSTKSLFLNMMALERFQAGMGNEVTTYAFFMDTLIDSERDVQLLEWYGIIIQNALGSDRNVVALFNSISKDVVLDPDNRFGSVLMDMNRYYNSWLL